MLVLMMCTPVHVLHILYILYIIHSIYIGSRAVSQRAGAVHSGPAYTALAAGHTDAKRRRSRGV